MIVFEFVRNCLAVFGMGCFVAVMLPAKRKERDRDEYRYGEDELERVRYVPRRRYYAKPKEPEDEEEEMEVDENVAQKEKQYWMAQARERQLKHQLKGVSKHRKELENNVRR